MSLEHPRNTLCEINVDLQGGAGAAHLHLLVDVDVRQRQIARVLSAVRLRLQKETMQSCFKRNRLS